MPSLWETGFCVQKRGTMTATMPSIPDRAPRFALARGPQTDEELWWCIYALWGVKVPSVQVCPHHVAPFTALANAYFARDEVAIWWASRGYGGKSFLLSTLVSTEAAVLSAQCSLLGGSGAQSLNVHNHTKELWASPMAPRNLLVNDNKFDTILSNKGSIRSLMASQGSVRGPHPQRLRMDEIDEMEQDILDAALGQPMRKRGIETNVVMSSTWQYPDGTMKRMMERAESAGWPIYSWCYRETSNPKDGWLSPSEVERQKGIVPRAMWDAEYELQEPSFDNRAIDQGLVEACFDKGFGSFTGDTPVIVEKEPKQGALYVTGVDWAKEKDRTVAATFRITDDEWLCVYWQQFNRLPWNVAVDRVYRQWQTYGGVLCHDQTGLGNVIHDLLSERVAGREELRRIKGVVMNRANSNAMFSDYVNAIERAEVRYPMIEMAFNEHRYATFEDIYTPKGHAPDSFVAGALAWSQRRQRIGKIAAAMSTSKVSGWSVG